MRRVFVFQWACLWAVAAFAPAGWAADCSEPVELPDKPELSQFADYNTFLVEVMDYKATKRERAQHRQACPEAYEPEKRPSRNPTVIREPETLSEALQRADRIPRLDYSQHQTWYNRTTSRSFPLPDLGRDELSDNMLEANLWALRSDASPRSGSGWLPGIFNTSLNMGRFSGKEAEYRDWLFFEEWLPEQEARAQLASTGNNFYGNRLTGITSIFAADSTGQRGTIYLGTQGQPIRTNVQVYIQDCLSSCVPD